MIYIDAQGNRPPKEIYRVLLERNLWEPNLRLDCPQGCPGNNIINCCARTLMANQPDFLAQQETCWIKEEGTKPHVVRNVETGEEIVIAHLVDFFPKFHCELNPIEMFWPWMKQQATLHCDYSFPKSGNAPNKSVRTKRKFW